MRWLVFSLTVLIFLTQGCQNSSLPDDIKIQINVPDEPVPGTRTKLITFDLQEKRDIFFRFFRETKQAGMCSPVEIEKQENAHEVMSVSFWGSARMERKSFNILKNKTGQWITTGFGDVEIYDHPRGFPCYKYSRKSLEKLHRWYQLHVPDENKAMR